MKKILVLALLLSGLSGFGCFPQAMASDRLMNLILNAPSDSYVIQLASYPNSVDLDKVLKELNFHKSLVAVNTLVNNKKHWVILEGIYSTQAEANRKAQEITANYSAIKPWVRKMGALKKRLAINSSQAS